MGLIDFLNVLLRLNIPLFCVLMFMKGRELPLPPRRQGDLSLGKQGAFLRVGAIHFHSSQRHCFFRGQQSQRTNQSNSTVFMTRISFLGFHTLGNHTDAMQK